LWKLLQNIKETAVITVQTLEIETNNQSQL